MPGIAQAPVSVFLEDFEAGASYPALLNVYNPAYTADAGWISEPRCNGLVFGTTVSDSPNVDGCGVANDAMRVRSERVGGRGAGNHSLGWNTATSAVSPGVVFRTGAFSVTPNRWYTVRYNYSSSGCPSGVPTITAYLLYGPTTAMGSQNLCTGQVGGNVNSGTFTSSAPVFVSNPTLQLALSNSNGAIAGNDFNIDDIEVLDATPQLDKDFVPATAVAGTVTTLRFTITNTTELGAKSGISIVDSLPAGMTAVLPIAAIPSVCVNSSNAAVTAPTTTVTATPSASVTISTGLPATAVKCTIDVPVRTAFAPGTYSNGPSNVTANITAPGTTTLTTTAQQTTPCTEPGILSVVSGASTTFSNVNMATGAATTAQTIPAGINGIGYNTVDNGLYGWRSAGTTTGTLVRIGPDGSLAVVGTYPTITANGDIVAGEVANGSWWGYSPGRWYRIDVTPTSPTFGQILGQGTTTASNATDWAFVPGEGDFLFALNGNNADLHLWRFSMATGVNTDLGSVAGLAVGVAVGATWADSNGYIYAADSNSNVFRVDVSANSGVLYGTTLRTTGNDGARCPIAVPLDFGDAPETFSTSLTAVLSTGGPRHSIVPGVQLGDAIDAEPDGQPSTAATADDTTGIDDEDGVTFNGSATPVVYTSATSAISNSIVVNASAAGFVSVWVDWNDSGIFDSAELMANGSAVTAGNNTLTFNAPGGAAGTPLVVRVRYASAAAEISTSRGVATSGEVEDYEVLSARRFIPSVCTDVGADTTYPAYSFATPTSTTSPTTYPNAGVTANGVPVDIRVSIVSGAASGTFGATTTNMTYSQAIGTTTLRYEIFQAGTTNPIVTPFAFVTNDLDLGETLSMATSSIRTISVSDSTSAPAIALVGANTVLSGAADSTTSVNWASIMLEPTSSFEITRSSTVVSPVVLSANGNLVLTSACRDWGDLPSSYGAPSHLGNTTLRMGALVDVGPAITGSAAADADDLNYLDDEDGLTAPVSVSSGTNAMATVTATNTGATAATLVGWLDLDLNGTFADSERRIVPVPAGTVNGSFTLTWLMTAAGSVPMRFRLFDGTVAAPSATDASAARGEVEDYVAQGIGRQWTAADCTVLNSFATSAEGWTARGVTQFGQTPTPLTLRYLTTGGNPGGVIGYDESADGKYSEIIYDLALNGFSSDLSSFNGGSLSFDYKAAAVALPIYVALYAPDGSSIRYVFQSQVTAGTAYHKVTIPFDSAQWIQSSNSAPVTPAQFAAALADTQFFAISAETSTGNDSVRVDNFGGGPCFDWGDAPQSYTTTGAAAPTHTQTTTNQLTLGPSVDIESRTTASSGADFDDLTGTDDENALSGLSRRISIATPVDIPVVNTTGTIATLAGWIDLNGNGVFEATERQIVAAPASDTYTLTFPGATLATSTYARFRLYPGIVANPLPTGAVTGGEIEDYAVAVTAPSLGLVKTAGTPIDVNGNGITDAGDTIQYSFTVTNTGTTAVSAIQVNDPLAGAVTCQATTLSPATATTCLANNRYTITSTNQSAGSVVNIATASGVDPSSTPVTSAPATTTTPVTAPRHSLAFEKFAAAPVDVNSSGITDAGDTIRFTFTVTNNGNVPVSAVSVVDPKAGAVTCQSTILAGGQATTCAADAVYAITATDEANGTVRNVAFARGTPAGGSPVDSNDDETTTAVTAQNPSLTIEKTAGAPVDVNASGLVDAGDTISYTFVVANNGNVPITAISVDDPLVGAVTCEQTTLAPSASMNCAAATLYTVTATDESQGAVNNTASAKGTDPDGDPIVPPTDNTTTLTQQSNPSLALEKTAGTPVDVNSSGLVDAGDTIAFSFVVTNNGNVPLTAIAVTDPLVGTVTCEATTLAVNASTTCVADAPYSVTESDETSGSVVNTASATGTDPDGAGVAPANDSTTTLTQLPNPALSLDKTAGAAVDVNASGIVDAGDTITYSFVVTNTGNVPISGIGVTDPKIGPVTCAQTSLAPNASTTCSGASYEVTEADEQAGSADNTAQATGVDPDNNPIDPPSDSTSTAVSTPRPSLTLAKSAGTPVDVNSSGLVDAGDTIAYTFTVTNNGNVPVTAVMVVDPLIGAVTCSESSLPVNASTACTADVAYVITDTDEAAGSVDNVAEARATDPDDGAVTSPDADTSTAVSTPRPALSIEKTAETPTDVNGSGLVDAGDTIAYSFVVTNTGNVPVSAVTVLDPLVGAVTCLASALAPSATTTCTADAAYEITPADEGGNVSNVAHAEAVDPDGGPVASADDNTQTPVDVPAPGLAIVKTAGTPVDLNNSGLVDAGDTIAYTFTVTNTGNVPISGVSVTDLTAGPVTCDETELGVGATAACAADSNYVITVDDELAGSVDNTASAQGTDPDAGVVTSPTAETSTPVDQPTPGLAIEKTAATPVDVNNSGLVDAGDTIAFTMTVTNTGNVPISAISVIDFLAGPVTCEEQQLAPAAATTCVPDALYVVTEADETLGSVDNVARAEGNDPDGLVVQSASDDTTTAVAQPDPALGIVKTASTPVDVNSSGLTDAGDTIAYSFTVTNTGNVPVSAVTVIDPVAGAVTCETTSLAVSASTPCTADAVYVVTGDDETRGSVVNVAHAEGLDPDGMAIASFDDDTNTPVDLPQPSLLLDKVAGTPVDVNNSGLTDAGDTIAFNFTVTNDGNVPVSGIAVADPLVGDVTCAETALAPDAATSCTANALYTVTVADERAGSVTNSATASGLDPDGGTTTSPADETLTPVSVPVPSLLIDKVAGAPVDVNASGLTDAGDTIAYTFTVSNNGSVPIASIAVADPKVGTVTCLQDTLAPDTSTTCTAEPYVVTATDETVGVVKNVASAAGTDPNGETVTSPSDHTTTLVTAPTPALDINKVAEKPVDVNSSGLVDAGDTIRYRFTVKNTGNVPIRNVAVDDPHVGTVTCTTTTLAPGASTTCTPGADYVITEDDENTGTFENTAVATGTDPDDDGVTSDPDATSTPVDLPTPSLSLAKTADPPVDVNGDGITAAGDTILYHFVVTNDGNVPMSLVGVADPKVGDVTCSTTTLAPGASTTCQADAPYVVTAADQLSGSVRNVATATGTDPDGGSVTSPPDETSTKVETPVLLLNLEKIAGTPVDVNSSGLTDAGDTIGYTFVATNNGNIPIEGIAISDPKVGTVTCEVTAIGPGEQTLCSADAPYVVTTADESAGQFTNSATANGTGLGGNPSVTSPPASTHTVVSRPTPSLSLEKTAAAPVDVNNSGLTDAGDTVAYTFTVTNTGNVPLHDLAIADDLVGAVTCAATTVAPDANTICTSDQSYEVTVADEGVGSVKNVATANALDPNNAAVASPPDDALTLVDQPNPLLDLEKHAGAPNDVNSSGLPDAGDEIQYTFTVTNEGDVPIHDIVIDDPLIGSATCLVTTLGPEESTTCTADSTYEITVADEAAGVVQNVASAGGLDPDNEAVTSPNATTSTLIATPVPSLQLVKTAGTPVDVNNSGLTDAGDTIAYTFVVTNNGNVPISAVAVNDPLVGAVTCETTALAPTASTTCSADVPYRVTEADERAGTVDNAASAAGKDPNGVTVTSPEDETSSPTTVANPSLTIDKTAGVPVDVNGSGLTDAGDTIAYTFVVTNNGNVPISAVAVNDPLAGDITCEATVLAPSVSTNCAADQPYTVTEADESAPAGVTNTATATGVDPDADSLTSLPDRTATPTQIPHPSLSIVKRAGVPVDVNGSGLTDAGDTIGYTFVVTNNGNVPISGIAVVDALAGTVECESTTLPVGRAVSCSAVEPYRVTEDDERAGAVTNIAHARGTDPDGAAVTSPEDETSTPTQIPNPSLQVEKTAGTPVDVNSSGLVDAGDTIAYTFAVTNNGNVPISGIAITDAKVGAVTCEVSVLAPNASTTCQTTAPYRVTEADEAAGSVENAASATGADPDGGVVMSPPDETSTATTIPRPSLRVEKTAGIPMDVNSSGLTDAGDTIAYTFAVTNNGNVPLSAVSISDPRAGAVTCESTVLAPGADTSCTAVEVYRITEADERAGSVDNAASATATDPDGGAVTSPEDETSTPTQIPNASLTIEKTAGTPIDDNDSGLTDAGDSIAYTFVVGNNGNVPVRTLAIIDPRVGAVACEAALLVPGASTTCATVEPYRVTEADERAGSVENAASATGFDPDGDPVSSAPDETSTPTQIPNVSLTLEKSAGAPVDVNDSGLTDAGDTIAYSFVVTNTGNVPISAVGVNDPLVGTVTCEATVLAPGAVTDCAAAEVYVITDADERAVAVTNTATATGTDPDGAAVVSRPDETSTPTQVANPSLSIEKTAGAPVDVNNSGLTDAGDTIAYTFVVTNTGNVPISAVGVNDPLAGPVACEAAMLAPGGVTDCAALAPYRITDDDQSAGSVRNTATAVGTDPDSDSVTSPEDDTLTPVSVPFPSLALDKSAGAPIDVNSSGLPDAGDTIAYRFIVHNNGNVPITSVAVTDPLVGAVTCEERTLAVGAQTTCTADEPYQITEEDELAGTVKNVATASGVDPDGGAGVSPEDDTSTPTQVPNPSLTLDKTAGIPVDVNNSGLTDAGDTIAYTFVVSNNGNVPLTSITVTDPLAGTVTCEALELAVGARTDCSAAAPYRVTEDDELAGSVTNVATAGGVDPDAGAVISSEDETSTAVDRPMPSMNLTKTADTPVDANNSGIVDAGDTIQYRFVLTNTGNVPLTGAGVQDELAGAVTCESTSLAVSESTDCAANQPYSVTVNDELAGNVVNHATGLGTDPDNGPVEPPGATTTTAVVRAAPALVLEKFAGAPQDANDSGIVDAGDTILYSFHVTNVGNVPLTNISIDDPLLEDILCPRETLAVASSTSCTATAMYVISAADQQAGRVTNVATALGTTANSARVESEPDEVTTPVQRPMPSLLLEKFASTPQDVDNDAMISAGDTIMYTFRVTNNGNVQINEIAVDDPKLSDVVCDEASLAVGEHTECAARAGYRITKREAAAGVVINTATATGSSVGGVSLVSPPDTTDTALDPPVTSPELPGKPPREVVPGERLPATGADVAPTLALVAALLLVGAMLIVGGRRRGGRRRGQE